MQHEDMPLHSSNLKRARLRAGISVTDLHEQAGISRMTYWRDEKPGAEIPKSRAEIYAAALGVKPAFLMGWEATFEEEAA